jgi:ribonuclease P protein component
MFFAAAARKEGGASYPFIPKDPKSGTMVVNEILKPRQRIRHRKLVQILFKKGKCYKGNLLILWIYQGPEIAKKPLGKTPAVGIMVSRKVDLRASRRNLWKRRIREAFRRQRLVTESPVAILIQSRKQKGVPSYEAVESELGSLLAKAKVTR